MIQQTNNSNLPQKPKSNSNDKNIIMYLDKCDLKFFSTKLKRLKSSKD